MRLRLRPHLSHHVTIMGTDTPRPGVRPGRQIQTLVTAMRFGPLAWMSHLVTTWVTPKPGVRPGRQIQVLVTAAGGIAVTTDIADANISSRTENALEDRVDVTEVMPEVEIGLEFCSA